MPRPAATATSAASPSRPCSTRSSPALGRAFASEPNSRAVCRSSSSTSSRRTCAAASSGTVSRTSHADNVANLASPDEALADVGGVNVHAGPAIDGRDRRRLERLCRYIARPPLAQERLELAPDGRRLIVRFKRAWRDGTHAVILDPLDFIARVVALIPPLRFNMLRYHGVLAARAKHRQEVVPGRAPEPAEATQLRLLPEVDAADGLELETSKPPSRHPWAWLLSECSRSTSWPAPSARGEWP